jgi:hypothetical protein
MESATNSSSNSPVASSPALIAYRQLVADSCQDVQRRPGGTNLAAGLFLFVYPLGLLLQLGILAASRRLAKHRFAFTLLLHIVNTEFKIKIKIN